MFIRNQKIDELSFRSWLKNVFYRITSTISRGTNPCLWLDDTWQRGGVNAHIVESLNSHVLLRSVSGPVVHITNSDLTLPRPFESIAVKKQNVHEVTTVESRYNVPRINNVYIVITYFFPGPDFTWRKTLSPYTTIVTTFFSRVVHSGEYDSRL